MVLGCSLCNQPLLIRPTKVGFNNPSSLMRRLRKNETENTSGRNIVDIQEAEIVATKCGHMFHRECLKNYFLGQSELKKCLSSSFRLRNKPQGCPMCFKPVIQSQLWPIVIRATVEEIEQMGKIKHLKTKNSELSKAMQDIRNRTKSTNTTLQDARRRMFECRIKMQEMDVTANSRDNFEKLEAHKKDMEAMLGAVNHQNMVLTVLTEQVSTCGQKLRSEQSNDSFCTKTSLEMLSPVARIVKDLVPLRTPKENNALLATVPENSDRQVFDLEIGEQFQLIESSVAASDRTDLQEQWDQVKKSFLDRLKDESTFIQDAKNASKHIPGKSNKYFGRRSQRQALLATTLDPISEAYKKSNKISTAGPASEFWKSLKHDL